MTAAGAAAAVAKSPAHKNDLLGAAEVWGVQDFDGDQVVLRVVQQVSPKTSDNVARELRQQILLAAGFQLVFNQSVLSISSTYA